MTSKAGHIFGLVGPLAAFPLRTVMPAAQRNGFVLHRGIRRRTTHLIVGRRMLTSSDKVVDKRSQSAFAAGRPLLSENGFLRQLGLLPAVDGRTLETRSLLAQSHLPEDAFDLLRLFDAFECDGEPFTFRDLILARKYAELIDGGARPLNIARSVQHSATISSVTSKTLRADRRGGVYASFGEGLGDLTGQLLLTLGEADSEEGTFATAEALEEDGQYIAAAELYSRCLGIDPTDSVAAFNRANCLRAAERPAEAAVEYLRALKIDPSFAEAWFNLSDLKADQGSADEARNCLRKAIDLDAGYADAIYNLARLEFEADNLPEARRLWLAYLKLDSTSDWAKTAMRGIQYADMQAMQRSAG